MKMPVVWRMVCFVLLKSQQEPSQAPSGGLKAHRFQQLRVRKVFFCLIRYEANHVGLFRKGQRSLLLTA